MKYFQIITSSILVLSLSGCSSLGSKPVAGPFKLRPVEEKTLANGLRILFIKDDSLPRISFHMMVMSGSAQDPVGAEGLTDMTLSLLETGTAKKNALQIADDFAQLGSSFGESATNDYVMLSTAGLAESKEKLLALYSDVILSPAFSAAEVERKRSQTLAEIVQMQDQPTEYAGLLFDRQLYGKHPYATPVVGTADGVKSLTRSQIIKHYFAFYRPNNAMLAIAGNFDSKFQQLVEKTFAGWSSGPVEKTKPSVPADGTQVDMTLFTKPGLQQTQIRMGFVGIGRMNPDFLKLRLANLILGGAFASRLNQRVRDDLGLTYSISSQFEAKNGTGSFEISTFSRNEKAGEAIKNTVQVTKEFQDNGATDKELMSAKNLLVGQFPAAIETVDRLAFNLLALRLYGVPDAYLVNFFDNVNSIRLKDLNETIKKHFKADQLKIVVFADEKAVQGQFKDYPQLKVEQVLQ
jgi:zinc protease